ncbi:hypothetical protein VTN96DRAFT_1851 [Rasamsonia emersonii]
MLAPSAAWPLLGIRRMEDQKDQTLMVPAKPERCRIASDIRLAGKKRWAATLRPEAALHMTCHFCSRQSSGQSRSPKRRIGQRPIRTGCLCRHQHAILIGLSAKRSKRGPPLIALRGDDWGSQEQGPTLHLRTLRIANTQYEYGGGSTVGLLIGRLKRPTLRTGADACLALPRPAHRQMRQEGPAEQEDQYELWTSIENRSSS